MLTETAIAGFEALVLAGPAAAVTVLPALGGKIVSLVDPRSRRQWLWRNEALDLRAPSYDASYVTDFDSGGWDECFPAVAPGTYPSGPWRGSAIPDHGELWGVPWEVVSQEADRLELAAAGVRFPVRFERTIAITDTGLSFAYRASNPTPFAFPFIWCVHPLLAVQPGMVLCLPDDVEFKIFGRDLGASCRLPTVLPRADSGLAIKAFGRSPAAGWVAVRDGTAEFRLQWDPATITHLGVWLNAGGWAGVPGALPYYNLGLEPGIGAGDDLGLAASILDEAGAIPARGYLEWTLYLHLAN